jgi:hypothetical protein
MQATPPIEFCSHDPHGHCECPACRRRSPLARFLVTQANARRMTIRDIAEQLQTLPKNAASRATVGRWFSGAAAPGDLEIAALANVLDAPESLIRSLHLLSPIHGTLGTDESALPALWTELIRSRPEVILVAGTIMTFVAGRIAGSVDLRNATILASIPGLDRPSSESDPTDPGPACMQPATASWLAAVDGLVALAGREPSNRVRLWNRDDRGLHPGIDGDEILANETLMIEVLTPSLDSFRIRVQGDPDWEPAGGLIASLRDESALPGSRLVFDSEWPLDSPMRCRFLRLRERVVRSLLHMPGEQRRRD